MVVIPMPSSLPSSYSRLPQKPPVQQESYSPPPEAKRQEASGESGFGALPLFVAIIALALAAASLYLFFYGEKPLTPSQQAELAGIASDLRDLQNKEISVYAPVKTNIYVNRSYPVRELFPATFVMPLDFEIPIDTELVGLGTTGQPVRFKVQESVPISVVVSVQSAKAFGNSTIQIDKNIPVDVELYSNVKIRSAYRQEIESMINRLDRLAGNASAG